VEALRVLLCEPYFGGSHRAWAEGLATHSAHDVRLVTHAGRFWRWRMQGAALTLARDLEQAAADYKPNVLLVSGMVHAAALLGLARRALAGVPVVLFLHENQLTYPVSEARPDDLTYAMTNWLSMAASDAVVFNSEFHRRELFGALSPLLGSLPDHRHLAEVDAVAQRCSVLPVGIDGLRLAAAERPVRPPDASPLLLWNHRWEHDKAPEDAVDAVDRLLARDLDVRVALAGWRPPTEPPLLAEIRHRWGDRLIHDGHLERPDYERLLLEADVALSTARHDFFGVAMAEAMAAGAVPVAPAALNYPDLVPEWAHDRCLYANADELDACLTTVLRDPGERRRLADRLRPAVAGRFDWSVVAPQYDALLAEVVHHH
jgi:glycosyltransferase involved in cell wall biosynthesis